jgi:UDP-GlcNAc:undecaprenyl-phosphate/decaprenyl-phosphate GlcNAc-1-phosphate transferase
VRLAGLVVSIVAAVLMVGPALRDMRASGLRRRNWRGREVAFPLGAVLVACSLVALAPLAILDDRTSLDLLDPDLPRWAVYVLGVTLLGLVDDALGKAEGEAAPRGWRGHARAVAAGSFSTGALKAIGALGLAAFATAGRGRGGLGYVVDLALLLLTTNLFNLLDLRPGRVEKVFAALLAVLCLAAWTVAPLDLLGVFIGPLLLGAAFTLRERAMLGDTGAYLAGAVAGIALLTVVGPTGRVVVLAVVAALTIFGEYRSISATIERVPLLRSLDSIGRLP